MRKIKEILRLRAAGVSVRATARACSLSHSTVSELLKRAQAAGVGWPLPEDMDETQLEGLLYPSARGDRATARPLPDWEWVHGELHKKGVTLRLLWLEYKESHPDDGYQYSQFSLRYRQWREKVDVVLRQDHRSGEKVFVDFAGQRVPVVEPTTGEIRWAHVFVATLGASNYTYAEATWHEDLHGWIGGHVRAFAFFGGVPEIAVPDNPKALVSQPSRYEPDLNPTYQDMAAHYGIAVIPARPDKPRDKAKVEKGVQVVEQWILARLRNRTFFSLAELNRAIRELLLELNRRPFQKLQGSRESLFLELDRPALKPLPSTPYEFATWKKVRANLDYHVEVGGAYYSVPYQLAGVQLDARTTATMVEVFHKGQRIACHARVGEAGGHSTQDDHRPASHRRYLQWRPSQLVTWAEGVGPETASLIRAVLEDKPHPEQGFRACLGIMRLGKHYPPERLEAACRRALRARAISYRSVRSILATGLDRRPLPESGPAVEPIRHGNVRGADYYAQEGANASC